MHENMATNKKFPYRDRNKRKKRRFVSFIAMCLYWAALSLSFRLISMFMNITTCCSAMHYWAAPRIFSQPHLPLTGDTRKIFVSNITVDESHSARVLIGCKPITSSVDRRDAPLGLAELGRVDIVNQNNLESPGNVSPRTAFGGRALLQAKGFWLD